MTDAAAPTVAAEDLALLWAEYAKRHGRWIAATVLGLTLLAYPLAQRKPPPPTAGQLIQESVMDYQEGKYREAIVAAQKAIELDPANAEAHNNKAVSLLGLQQWDDAMQSALMALRLNPNSQLIRNNLAWIVRERASHAGQAAVALRSAPPVMSASDYLNRSLDEFKAGQSQQCIDDAQQALKLQPDFPEAYNNMAVGLIALHRYDEAIAAAGKAIQLRPDFQIAKNNLAWAEQEKRKAASPR